MVRFRLVSSSRGIARLFCQAVERAGMDPLPIFARESFPLPETNWIGQIEAWKVGLPDIRYWQIGNEADQESASSWTLPEAEFSELLAAGRHALGVSKFLIAGGMVSGQPGYLDGVDLGPVDAIAVHPYGQRPSHLFPRADWGFGTLTQLLARYRRFRKPLWITEYGAPVVQFQTASERGEYYGRMIATSAELECAAILPFKWEDAGVPGFGITGTPAAAAVSDAIRALASQTMVSRGGPMKLEDVAAKHGGFYAPPVVIGGTKSKPTARIGWINDTEDGFVLEIGGEAADAVYVPKV